MTNNTNGNKPTDSKSSDKAKDQQSKHQQTKQEQSEQAQQKQNEQTVTEQPSAELKQNNSLNQAESASTTAKKSKATVGHESETSSSTTPEAQSTRKPVTPLSTTPSSQTQSTNPGQAAGNSSSQSAPQSTATVVKRGWSGPIALVISLAALAGVGGIAYLDYDIRYYMDKKQSFDPIQVSQTEAAKVESKLAESVNSTARQVTSKVNEVTAQLGQQQQQLSNTEQKLKQEVLGVAENVSNLRRQFNQMQGTSRDDWQLAEVEYMLRLANQRLLMEGDIRGVEAILVSADAILRGLDNYSLYSVREALAKDLAAVRAVEQIDVEGTYLQLDALVNQIMALPLMPVADYQKSQSEPAKSEQEETNFSSKLSAKLQRTWDNFSDHLRINISRDKPVQVLLTPKEEMFLRQNLRMMLEQAQLALLQQNQVIYSNSLKKSVDWLKEFFIYDSAKVAAINKQLQQLTEVKLNPQLPDISGSLKAAKQYIDELHRLHKGKLPRKDEVANAGEQATSANLDGEAH
ncbi:uroporphyrinogen-III C-methyltransferase [Spartinivicinus ruber]|uniref:uroporphyrinogen-III C-methyltransferase n=1 Tax=Spartinivicinus ruber TaxID=2683272 RepID=UPI0013D8907A|nr:uroporphyrinogen-III C-methyltransferase [Spartinivicinus ruber]